MMGNHGPAYFRRYPPQFRRFLPDCETAELRDCTREQVVNAYDNAILYTDHVLASVIATLQDAPQRLDSAMMYVSDHGESLGEKGLYLHGIPYAIAPAQQTHVPMVLWLSPAMSATGDVNVACVRSRAHEPLSHDNLFHSVLGLMDVRTAPIFLPATSSLVAAAALRAATPARPTTRCAENAVRYGHGQAQPQHRARRGHRRARAGILPSLESAVADARHAARHAASGSSAPA